MLFDVNDRERVSFLSSRSFFSSRTPFLGSITPLSSTGHSLLRSINARRWPSVATILTFAPSFSTKTPLILYRVSSVEDAKAVLSIISLTTPGSTLNIFPSGPLLLFQTVFLRLLLCFLPLLPQHHIHLLLTPQGLLLRPLFSPALQ